LPDKPGNQGRLDTVLPSECDNSLALEHRVEEPQGPAVHPGTEVHRSPGQTNGPAHVADSGESFGDGEGHVSRIPGGLDEGTLFEPGLPGEPEPSQEIHSAHRAIDTGVRAD
jgi:hypothetical protein